MKLTLMFLGLSLMLSVNAVAAGATPPSKSYFSDLVKRSQGQEGDTTPQCAVCCSWLKAGPTILSCIPTC